MKMGTTRYRVLFGLMILYMSVACLVACSLLWNITVTHYSTEEIARDEPVPVCSLMQAKPPDPLLNCTIFEGLEPERFVANGWTKVVHKARLSSGSIVAIKSVNTKGKDISDCAKTQPILLCHNRAVNKILREIQLLQQLKHDTIIQLKHYCAKVFGPGQEQGQQCTQHALIATEMGDPVTNLRLLQMTWKERSQLIVDLARLIDFADHSPLGVLTLSDLRRPQFVLVNGRMKLSDLDDIVIGEPACTSDAICSTLINATMIECIAGRCEGYSARFNIQKSYREFGPYIFIPDGVPKEKKGAMEKLRRMWKENIVTTKELLSASNALLL